MLTDDEFVKIYDDQADAIFRYCYYRVFDREKARDLVQETFTRTWEYLLKGNEVLNFRAFLYRTARNLIIDHARKRKEMSLTAMQEEGFEPADDNTARLQEQLDARAALKVVRDLPEIYREAVTLRYINDLMPKDIAEILGESENVISVRINRGVNLLRKFLEKYE